jgi:hypothetical protein
VEVPVFIAGPIVFECYIGSHHTRRIRQVAAGILDDLCRVTYVGAASEWAEVDTVPLIHVDCYRVTEARGQYLNAERCHGKSRDLRENYTCHGNGLRTTSHAQILY